MKKYFCFSCQQDVTLDDLTCCSICHKCNTLLKAPGDGWRYLKQTFYWIPSSQGGDKIKLSKTDKLRCVAHTFKHNSLPYLIRLRRDFKSLLTPEQLIELEKSIFIGVIDPNNDNVVKRYTRR